MKIVTKNRKQEKYLFFTKIKFLNRRNFKKYPIRYKKNKI